MYKKTNEVIIKMLSKSENERFARVAVATFASQIDMTIEELSDIKTAISEAVTNSIVHGYEGTEGFVTLECRLYGNILEVVVADNGKGIDDVDRARQPLYTSKPEQERSGMGFTVMETFMDSLEVKSMLGLGTKVSMKKILSNHIKK